MSVERKLAAIMFTDIVDYTAQMSENQDLAFTLLEQKQNVFRPLVKEHNGVMIKEMGDGTLSHYPTAIDASTCSLKLQKNIQDNTELNVRVGIHLGDIMFKDNDVFGDGVNIASRLESMCPPGGVLVSKNVYDEILSREGFEGISLGLQSLKGVGRLVEVYALKNQCLTVPEIDDYKDTTVNVHKDDETPSVAIIPLKNKGAEEDIFYAYGISADLIKACSSGGKVRVESLDNIETVENYDKLSAQELASKLSVRYISTGSLWKMGEMFQLSIELYDTVKSQVVWSDRWQENWDNLAIIKGNLSDGIIKVLDTKKELSNLLESDNPEAYEYYLKAKYKYKKRKNKNDIEVARGLLSQALALDAQMLAAMNLNGTTYLEMGEHDQAMAIYKANLETAKKKKNQTYIAISLTNIGIIHKNKGEYLEAIENYLQSYSIQSASDDKNGMSNTLGNLGVIYRAREEYDKALDKLNQCYEIQEELDNKRMMGFAQQNIANIYMDRAQYDKSLKLYKGALKISKEIDDKHLMSIVQGNIAIIYKLIGSYNKALDNHFIALEFREALGNQRAVASTLHNIGIAYHYLGQYDNATEYYLQAKELRIKIDDKLGLAHTLLVLGIINENLSQFDKAREYLEQSLDMQKEIGVKKGSLFFESRLYWHVINKQADEPFNKERIIELLEIEEGIDYIAFYKLYQLLDDPSYLRESLNVMDEIATSLSDPEDFYKLPFPSAIIEEANSIFTDKSEESDIKS